jgi:hypothetical protein
MKTLSKIFLPTYQHASVCRRKNSSFANFGRVTRFFLLVPNYHIYPVNNVNLHSLNQPNNFLFNILVTIQP